MTDVAVIGGGPAGLAAADRLASHGHSVEVFEEHETIGLPVHCTGVLAADALNALDLPREAVLNSLSTVRFVAPAGGAFDYTTPSTEAVVIDRLVFDRAMADRAIRSGATIHRGRRVTAVDSQSDGVALTFSNGATTRVRAVVIACGAQYGLQRRLGLQLPPVYLQSAQLELPAERPGHVEICFGSLVAPKGFAWAVPVERATGSFVRVGVMAEAHVTALFWRMLRQIDDRWGIAVPEGAVPRRRLLPLAAVTQTYSDRVLVAGDAAGLVKPTTGGGIYYSVISGRLAADALAPQLAADKLRARDLAGYERQWRKSFQPEFKAQLALRRVAEHMDDAAIDSLFELARTDGVLPLVRRYAAFNRHRDFIAALFRHPPARQVFRRHLVAMLP